MDTTITAETHDSTAKYLSEDFRVYAPERVYSESARDYLWLQLCEALVEGRWEPFVSTHAREPRF